MRDAPARGAGRPAVPTTGQRVREVLSSRGFRRLFATRLVSQFGDGVFQLAAADILLFDEPGANPALKLAAITAITLIPFSAIAPFTGVFIDRWDRRTILAVTPLVRAVLAALVPLLSRGEGPGFYVAVLVVLSVNRLFLATMSAVLPQLVPEDDLLVANSVATTGGSVANVVGLGTGAALAGALSGESAAAIAAIAFAATTVLARSIAVHRGHDAPPSGPLAQELRAVLAELREGVARVRESRRSVFALSAISAAQALVGLVTGATAYYFIAELQLDVGDATRLLAMIAVGIFAGVVAVPFAGRRIRHDRLVPASFAIAAASVLATGASLSRGRMVAGAALVGVAYAFAKIPVDTIVQEEIPDEFRGRAFSAYDVLFNLARFAGVLAAALWFQSGARPGTVVVGTGVMYALAAAAFVAWEHRLERERIPEAESLLPPGERVVVRAYAGSRADEEPRAILVGGRELAIDEVLWRAVEERAGERRRIFVVRVGAVRVRLANLEGEGAWEVDRILPPVPDAP